MLTELFGPMVGPYMIYIGLGLSAFGAIGLAISEYVHYLRFKTDDD